MMAAYFWLQKYYRRTYVECQRLDSTSRSPVFAHFSETLAGVETIRAFGRSDDFVGASATLVDVNHTASFSLRSADQWLSLRLELISGGIVLTTAVLAIAERGHIPAALAALTMSESIDIVGFLKYAGQWPSVSLGKGLDRLAVAKAPSHSLRAPVTHSKHTPHPAHAHPHPTPYFSHVGRHV